MQLVKQLIIHLDLRVLLHALCHFLLLESDFVFMTVSLFTSFGLLFHLLRGMHYCNRKFIISRNQLVLLVLWQKSFLFPHMFLGIEVQGRIFLIVNLLHSFIYKGEVDKYSSGKTHSFLLYSFCILELHTSNICELLMTFYLILVGIYVQTLFMFPIL